MEGHNQTTQTRTNEGKNNSVAQPIKLGDRKHTSYLDYTQIGNNEINYKL